MLKDYYSLTKSGLVYGNLIPVIGGFAVAARKFGGAGGSAVTATSGANVFVVLIATLIGIALVMASGSVFNNIIDRDIDANMARTKDRALVGGRISVKAACAFAITLAAIGFATLAVWTNLLTLTAGAFGFFAYVVLYSLWTKRRTVYGTAVGSISGAMPPVVGYVAASGRLDLGAALLFIILALWQMPHFFAIGLYRRDDYAAAKIPILPVKTSPRKTKIAMTIYIVLFMVATILLATFGYVDQWCLMVGVALSFVWFGLSFSGFTISDNDVDANKQWARKMFFCSLFVLVFYFIAIIFF